MRRCEECGKTEILAEIYDTVDRNKARQLCNSCAFRNDAVIIRKPSQKAIENINSKENVYNRLRREAGLEPIRKQEYSYSEQSSQPYPRKMTEPSGTIQRAWKTTEEKNQEREFERRERELAEIRKIKLEEEQRAKEIEDLEKEGKIDFKSKFLTVLDLKKIRERKRQEKEIKEKELLEKEAALNDIMDNGVQEEIGEEVINDHNKF